MPTIHEEIAYDGAQKKIERLGLAPLLTEIRGILTGFPLTVKEERDANGAAIIREMIDARFAASAGWTKTVSGDIDWVKCKIINGSVKTFV